MQILKDNNGKSSSKRVMGVVYMVVLLILFIYKEWKTSEIANPEIFIGMLATGGTLIGMGVLENFAKFKTK